MYRGRSPPGSAGRPASPKVARIFPSVSVILFNFPILVRLSSRSIARSESPAAAAGPGRISELPLLPLADCYDYRAT